MTLPNANCRAVTLTHPIHPVLYIEIRFATASSPTSRSIVARSTASVRAEAFISLTWDRVGGSRSFWRSEFLASSKLPIAAMDEPDPEQLMGKYLAWYLQRQASRFLQAGARFRLFSWVRKRSQILVSRRWRLVRAFLLPRSYFWLSDDGPLVLLDWSARGQPVLPCLFPLQAPLESRYSASKWACR